MDICVKEDYLINKKFENKIMLASSFSRMIAPCKLVAGTESNTSLALLDTGCPNTIIPVADAKKLGIPLNMQRVDYSRVTKKLFVAGAVINAVPYIIPVFKIGTFEMKNVAVLAGDVKLGENTKPLVILGLNIMNVWERYVVPLSKTIYVNENPISNAQGKTSMYSRYVDSETGSYLLVDIEDKHTPRSLIKGTNVFGKK